MNEFRPVIVRLIAVVALCVVPTLFATEACERDSRPAVTAVNLKGVRVRDSPAEDGRYRSAVELTVGEVTSAWREGPTKRFCTRYRPFGGSGHFKIRVIEQDGPALRARVRLQDTSGKRVELKDLGCGNYEPVGKLWSGDFVLTIEKSGYRVTRVRTRAAYGGLNGNCAEWRVLFGDNAIPLVRLGEPGPDEISATPPDASDTEWDPWYKPTRGCEQSESSSSSSSTSDGPTYVPVPRPPSVGPSDAGDGGSSTWQHRRRSPRRFSRDGGRRPQTRRVSDSGAPSDAGDGG